MGVDARDDDALCWTFDMLRGEKVLLRARHEADVAILQTELYDDIATYSRADTRPWRPISPASSASPYAIADPTDTVAPFSVVELASDELAGDAALWGIDVHNRRAHLGLALRPAFRGRGLGSDVVRVLCRYGFEVRGIHRIQIETLTDNAAMMQAALQAGFVREGVRRHATWVSGSFADEVILGLLDTEWREHAT